MTAGWRALSRLGLRPRVLVLVDLVQDIDVLLPLLVQLDTAGFCALRIRVSRWLETESPRTAALLRANALRFHYVRRNEVTAGRAPSLAGVAAVLTASESTHPAHAAGHALARRARAAGLRTYVLQHGLENVGLFGWEAKAATFASEAIFCWFPAASIPSDLDPATAAKLVHVGRCTPRGGWRRTGGKPFDLGVFENLHWDRYSDTDRESFRLGLLAAGGAKPPIRILVRPHPAGGWGDGISHELAQFPNITPALAAAGRTGVASGVDLLQGVRRVITTPSTIALDAALAGVQVAVATDGGAVYAPLQQVRTPQDWTVFASGRMDDPLALDQFRSRVLVEGDAAPRIVERLHGDLVAHLGRNV